jgi:hypothetical protein
VQGDDKSEDGKSERAKPVTPSTVTTLTVGSAVEPLRGEQITALDLKIQAQLGHRLKAIYNEVLNEPVPDRFRLLLDELDAKTAAQKPETSGGAR